MEKPPRSFESRTGFTESIPPVPEQVDYWNERWINSRTPNPWQLRQGEAIVHLLDRFQIKDVPILDVGCGTGWLTAKLCDYGTVKGIDLSEAGISIARENHPDIDFKSGDFFEMEYPDKHFGLVVAQEVIAHVYDQDSFVKKLYRILDDNGYLIVTTANRFVVNRLDLGYERSGHIKKWLSLKDLNSLFVPSFHVISRQTVLPMGHKGVLRIANSYKLNHCLQYVFGSNRLTSIKEKMGLGYTRILLCQKRVLH